HRVLLSLLGPNGEEVAKEIVSTVELSQYGAHIRGRRILTPESEGVLTQLSSGRQARVRIAWQEKSATHHGFYEAGVELLSGFDYWAVSFVNPPAVSDSAQPQTANALTLHELLYELVKNSSEQAPKILESVWCGLVEELESRKIVHRDELVSSIRAIAEE